MNKILLLIILVVILGCNQPNNRSSLLNESEVYSKKIDEYFQKLIELEKFNGAVFINKNGRNLIYKNFNIQIEKPKSLKTKINSQFDIHSISKLMAKAAIVDLEIEGKVSPKDFISKHLKHFPNGDKITIQHLLDNQSGLPREFTFEIDSLINYDPDQLVELIKKENILYDPGTDSSYSNLGYQLLYFIISKITKKPFVEYLNDQYFSPLQMNKTGAHFHLNKNNKGDLIKNHELDDENEIVIVSNIQAEDKNQAKLYSNIDNLNIFLNHLKNPRYINKLKNKNRNTIGWSGGGDGILSHIEYNFKGDYDLIFFSNYDEIPFGDIVLTVEKIMTNQQYELPEKISRIETSVPLELLKPYEGSYRMKEFNNSVFQFKIENNQFVFYQDGIKNTTLKAETYNTFFDSPSDEDYFEFRKLDNGLYELIYYYKKVPIKGKIEVE